MADCFHDEDSIKYFPDRIRPFAGFKEIFVHIEEYYCSDCDLIYGNNKVFIRKPTDNPAGGEK